MKTFLKALVPQSAQDALRNARQALLLRSLRAAVAEQDLDVWVARHAEVFPELSRQYTDFVLDSDYLKYKVRAQQSFQVSLAAPVLAARRGATVVDVGDSSGAHIAALKALLPDGGHRFLSVNLDAQAVARVQHRGLEALLCRAESLQEKGVHADVFLSFETLEHLCDPATFLHRLSKTPCQRLVLTVPYVSTSRVGLHHLRAGLSKRVSPETVHLFELCPEDLKLLARHCGWAVETERIYRQYPLHTPLRATRAIWRAYDFEGFYGMVLYRDSAWSSLYTGWDDREMI
ncbi:MAG: methyltransferase domain-containing protein [Elusimicrobiota bacterium]